MYYLMLCLIWISPPALFTCCVCCGITLLAATHRLHVYQGQLILRALSQLTTCGIHVHDVLVSTPRHVLCTPLFLLYITHVVN
jgi:hypothetical protein